MKISTYHVGLIIVLLFTTLVSSLVFFNIILPGDSFHWDESHHGIYGVWLSKNIANGDWASSWHNTHRHSSPSWG